MIQNPISFKLVRNITPFATSNFDGVNWRDASLGSGLNLINVVTIDLTVKPAASAFGGVRLRLTGRTEPAEATQAVVPNGVLAENGEIITPQTRLTPGVYKIYYDVSALTEAWLWIRPISSAGSSAIKDIVDVRVSLQNTDNASLPTRVNAPSIMHITGSTTSSGGWRSTPLSKAVKIKVDITGAGTGIFELWVNARNISGTVQGIRLHDSSGKLYPNPVYSSNIDGWYYKLQSGTFEFIAILSDYDQYEFIVASSGDHTVPMEYDITVLSADIPNLDTGNGSDVKPVYRSKSFVLEETEKVSDCYRDTFVGIAGNGVRISTTGADGVYRTVPLTDENFPNLKAGSSVYKCMVLPFMRDIEWVQDGRNERVVVVTSKGQVYHNYPKRPGGTQAGDEFKFDESVIWDLPVGQTSRRHPSNDPSESRTGYSYDPTLSTYSYTLEPAIDSDNGYGHGGFGSTIGSGSMTRPRFYQFAEPIHDGGDTNKQNVGVPFRNLSLVAKTRKMSFLGAYQITRQRVCLFGTNDGGRNWFVMYEFASGQPWQGVGWGQVINTSTLPAYVSGSFSVVKRSFIRPTLADKEPTNRFSYSPPVEVSAISSSAEAVVTTATPHQLEDRDIIIFEKSDGTTSPYDFMVNTQQLNSGGTGKMYQVEILTPTTFKLHEYIYSPDNNITARHIHYTQTLKDFIAFGTGERHPDGWLMLLDMRRKDAYDFADPVTIWYNSFRLNSANEGIQRTCGFWMRDDDPKNPTIYCPMDDVTVSRPQLEIAGRTDLPRRSSAGILKGKLSDIDDISKFESVFDVEDVNIWSVDYNGIILAGFMAGHVGVSLDGGDTWEVINLSTMPLAIGFDSQNRVYFNNGLRMILK